MAIHLLVMPVLEDSPRGAMLAKHILRGCSDNPYEAALALAGVQHEVMRRGRHALPGTNTMLRLVHGKMVTSMGCEKRLSENRLGD